MVKRQSSASGGWKELKQRGLSHFSEPAPTSLTRIPLRFAVIVKAPLLQLSRLRELLHPYFGPYLGVGLGSGLTLSGARPNKLTPKKMSKQKKISSIKYSFVYPSG